MANTVKATFTLQKETMDILIEVIPINERSRTVNEAIQSYLKEKQKRTTIDEFLKFRKTLKFKNKESVVEWLRKDRASH